MNQKKFKRITYLIVVTMLLVILTQIYRSIGNYEVNKERFIKDVQTALDLSIENYYADRAKDMIYILSYSDSISVSKNKGIGSFQKVDGDSIEISFISKGNGYTWKEDSGLSDPRMKDTSILNQHRIINKTIDSISVLHADEDEMALFAKKIMLSITEDEFDVDELSEKLEAELERKELNIGYELFFEPIKSQEADFPDSSLPLRTISKSTYLPRNQSIIMFFENASLIILKRGLGDLLISLGIVMSVLMSLIYLYRVIMRQKQLALIKDDLISNITHEFKTPIATISSAIEGISSFNQQNDPEKTRRYLGISNDQLNKLNLMVEKLLETATIDSNELETTFETVDIAELTRKVVNNFDVISLTKKLSTSIQPESFEFSVDPFHFENALSNLIDNAIKYGGDIIEVSFQVVNGHPQWKVIDDGGKIEKVHQSMIFEKLYRIPKGNQHDVKGFGIGLYYTRAIVEKHHGNISLEVKPNYTCFTIKL